MRIRVGLVVALMLLASAAILALVAALAYAVATVGLWR